MRLPRFLSRELGAMAGEVLRISKGGKDSFAVTVSVGGGELTLSLSVSDVDDLKPGDRVTCRVARA